MAGIYAGKSESAKMGLVEIIEPSDVAYFTAHLLDIDESAQKIQVRYQNEDETTWVEAARVRACPAARSEQEVAQFTPQAGEKVEVLFIEEECGTESWWLGTVQSAKGLYFKVSFPDGEDSETQEVVEQERMRPVTGHNPAKFVRRLFRIPAGQEKNMAMTASQLPKLAKLSELFALNLSPDGKSLVGIGVSRALDTAQGLLDMHFKKLPQYAQMAMHEEQLKRQLKQTEQQKSYGSKVEFAVNGDHVGMVIGTNGNNIKKAQAIPGVHLIEVTRENKVIVYADKREQADAARELLEIIHSRVPVDSSEIGYIIGKGGEQIRDLQASSGCRMDVDRSTSSVNVVGPRGAVAKASAMLQYTIEMLKDTRMKGREIQELSGELKNMGVPLLGAGFNAPGGYGNGYGNRGGAYGIGMPVRGRGAAMARGRGRGLPVMRGRGGAAAGMPSQQQQQQQQQQRVGGNAQARGGIVARGGRGGTAANGIRQPAMGAQQRGGKQGQPSTQSKQQPQQAPAAASTPQQQAGVKQSPQNGGQAPAPSPQQPQAKPQPQGAKPAPQGAKPAPQRGGKQAAAPEKQQPAAAAVKQVPVVAVASEPLPQRQPPAKKDKPKTDEGVEVATAAAAKPQNGASAATGGDRDGPSLREQLEKKGKAVPVARGGRGGARGGSARGGGARGGGATAPA